MKLPAQPPSWPPLLKKGGEALVVLTDEEGVQLVRRANDAYWHWDQLRRRPMPKSWKPESAWAAVKLNRSAQRRGFGLRDRQGEAFTFWLPERAQRDLHEIDKGLGGYIGLDQPGQTERDRQRYLIGSLQEEAIASSLLEGAATTRREAKNMLRHNRPPRSLGERMVFNNYRTILELREWKGQALSVERVLDIHRRITSDTLDNPLDEGRLRTPTDRVRVEDVRDNQVLHVPPAAGELSQRMAALCAFANEEAEEGFLHPVVRAILIHFWLAYDHPFVDGNGRAARSLFYWSMLRSGYWLFEFLPISRIINMSPVRYGRAFLYAESDECDATYFIMFHLQVIRKALRDLHAYLVRRQDELIQARRLLAELPGFNFRQAALLREALASPRIETTIASYRREYRVSYGTAYNDLQQLVERDMLARVRRGRQWLYYPTDELARKLKPR